MVDGSYFIPKDCINAPDLSGISNTLRAFTRNTKTVEQMPLPGVQCISGCVYQYGDGVESGYSEFYICRVTHTKKSNNPWDDPDSFTFSRPNSDNLPWMANEYVYSGWTRVSEGKSYSAATEHLTANSWVSDKSNWSPAT